VNDELFATFANFFNLYRQCKMRAALTHPASNLFKKVSGWMLLYVAHTVFLNVVKKMTFTSKTNLVFWICLVVACVFADSLQHMAVNKFRKPSIFSKEKWV